MKRSASETAPKQPQNHFAIFRHEYYAEQKAKGLKVEGTSGYNKWSSDVAKPKWDSMTANEKKPYIDKFNQQLKVYNDYIAEHGKPGKKKKDDKVPTHPGGTFLLFSNYLREQYKGDKTVDKNLTAFSKFASKKWHELGVSGQQEWHDLYKQKKAEYDAYVKQNGPIEKTSTKPRLPQKAILPRRAIRCPLDQLESPDFYRHVQLVHFPTRKVNHEVANMYTDFCQAVVKDDQIANNWNREFVEFFHILFKNQWTADEMQKIASIQKHYDELMSVDGKKGKIYALSQILENFNFDCQDLQLIEIINYFGEHTELGQIRHFFSSKLSIAGNVGRKIGQTVVTKTAVYTWIAIDNVPEASLLTLEHCVIMARMNLSLGTDFCWNQQLNSIHAGHPLHKEHPKILVLIGLYALRQIIGRLRTSLNDETFFKNDEIVNIYYGKFDDKQRDEFDRSHKIFKYALTLEQQLEAIRKEQEQVTQERDQALEKVRRYQEKYGILEDSDTE